MLHVLHNCELTNINSILRIDITKLGLGGALADAEETRSRVAIAIGCLVLSKDLCNPSTNRTMVHCFFPLAFICISAGRIVQGNLVILFQSSTCAPIFFTVSSPLWHSFLRSQMRTMLLIPWRKQEVSEDNLLSFCYLSCLPLCMLLSFSMEKTRVSEDMYHLSLIYLLPFVLLLSSWSLIIIGCSFHRS